MPRSTSSKIKVRPLEVNAPLRPTLPSAKVPELFRGYSQPQMGGLVAAGGGRMQSGYLGGYPPRPPMQPPVGYPPHQMPPHYMAPPPPMAYPQYPAYGAPAAPPPQPIKIEVVGANPPAAQPAQPTNTTHIYHGVPPGHTQYLAQPTLAAAQPMMSAPLGQVAQHHHHEQHALHPSLTDKMKSAKWDGGTENLKRIGTTQPGSCVHDAYGNLKVDQETELPDGTKVQTLHLTVPQPDKLEQYKIIQSPPVVQRVGAGNSTPEQTSAMQSVGSRPPSSVGSRVPSSVGSRQPPPGGRPSPASSKSAASGRGGPAPKSGRMNSKAPPGKPKAPPGAKGRAPSSAGSRGPPAGKMGPRKPPQKKR